MKTRLKSISELAKCFGFLFLFVLIYWGLAHLGFLIASLHQSVSPVWPAAGFAIGVLWWRGASYWPAVFLGALFSNLQNGTPISAAAGIASGNCLEAILGVYLISKFSTRKLNIAIYGKSIGFLIMAALSAVVSASLGTLVLWLNGSIPQNLIWPVWLTWWSGNALGAIIVVPIFEIIKERNFPKVDFVKMFLCLTVSVAISTLLFFSEIGTPYIFSQFLVMLASLVYSGEFTLFLSSAVVCALSVWSTKNDTGIFYQGLTHSNIVELQLFLAALGITSLALRDLQRAGYLRKAALALLIGWILAGLAFAGFHAKSKSKTDDHFAELVNDLELSLQQNVKLNFSILQAAAGLFVASSSVEEAEWKKFSRAISFKDELGGMRGIGLIYRVVKGEETKFIETQRKQGRKNFKLKAVSKEVWTPESAKPENFFITYLEPMETNREAIGLDFGSEKNRLEAIERARDSAEATISRQIFLVQDSVPKKSFALLFPIYAGGEIPSSVEERRKNLLGFSYAPVHIDLFFKQAFAKLRMSETEYSISELNIGRESSEVVTESENFSGLENSEVLEREFEMGGQFFKLRVKKSRRFLADEDTTASWAGAVAAFLSLALGGAIGFLQFVKERALAIAEEKTKELRESEERWKFAIEGSGDGVWDWQVQTGNLTLSKRWKELHGYQDHELENSLEEWKSRVHPEDLARVMEAINAHLENGVEYAAEYRMKVKDGSYHWYLDRGMVMARDANNKPLRMIGTLADITLRKMHERELEFQRQKLITSAKMSSLGEMAAGIAHEINNPLAIITGKVSVLKEHINAGSIDSKKLLENLDKIDFTAHRIAKIIRGLRSFSRNSENDPMENILVSNLMNDVLELSKERFRKNGIDLRVNAPNIQSLYIRGRGAQLCQVLLNFLSNSFDAVEGKEQKWVEFSCERLGNQVRFSVMDSGDGIPKQNISRILEPFFTTKPVGKGTGLGLSISKGILEDHGTTLIYDEASRNTRFYFDLAISQEKAL